MADNDLQDDDQKGKKSARFKSFEPNTRSSLPLPSSTLIGMLTIYIEFTKWVLKSKYWGRTSPYNDRAIRTPDEVKPSSSNFQFVEVNNTTIATPSTRKAVRSYVMRKFHREKRAEVSGKTKGSGTDQIWTDGMVTPDISEQPQTVFGGVELSFRIPTQGTQLETDVENTQLTGIDRALSAELSANYCASLPGNVMMIIEPVPPLVTKFPVPQESMRHVHFCEFPHASRCGGGGAPHVVGMFSYDYKSCWKDLANSYFSHYHDQQVLCTHDTYGSKRSKLPAIYCWSLSSFGLSSFHIRNVPFRITTYRAFTCLYDVLSN